MPAPQRVRVWDPAVRLLHWALATLIVGDLVFDEGDYAHRMVGYAAVVVVLLRLTWAALSSAHGRLAALRPSVADSTAYLRLLLLGRSPQPVGHNPLGLWMVWAIWILVLLLGLTGWLSRTDAFWGDEIVELAHETLANLMIAAIALHLAGVLAMSWLWRVNLPAAMITGWKRISPP
jgi:cytochrome b